MIPRFGEPPRKDVKYTLRPGAYAILPRGRHVLLTVQLDLEWDVQLPGGGIDPGESPLQALPREVLEETGWRVTAPTRLGVFQRFVFMEDYDLWAQKICTVYVAHPVRQIAEPTEAGHRSFWVGFDEAVHELGNEGDRSIFRAYTGV